MKGEGKMISEKIKALLNELGFTELLAYAESIARDIEEDEDGNTIIFFADSSFAVFYPEDATVIIDD